MPVYYGLSSVISNVHNLLHIADDAINMFCDLHTLYAFPFENMLGIMRRYLRSGYKPIEQICNRVNEMWFEKKDNMPK